MADLCSEIEKFGKGICNASRYKIIEVLYKGPKTVTEIVKAVRLSQPSVSQHLKTLKINSIVVDERRGQEVFYSLNTKYVLELLSNLTHEVRKNKKILS